MSDCFLMGHGGYALPKLDPSYPEDITLTSYNALATFSVKIAKEGRPKKYTYKWYFSEDEGKTFKEVSNGNDTNILQISGYNGEQTYQVYCKVSNKKGTVNSRVAKMTVVTVQPLFTYIVDGVDQTNNASYVKMENSGGNNWKINFYKSGTLKMLNRGSAKEGIDAFLVGGGGGGGGAYLSSNSFSGGGGGGGYVSTSKGLNMHQQSNYTITVGTGGAGGSGGGRTAPGETGTAGTKSAIKGTEIDIYANGGAGGYGGGRHVNSVSGGAGGSGGGAGGEGSASWSDWNDRYENNDQPGGGGGSGGEAGGNSKNFKGGAGAKANNSNYNSTEFGEGSGNQYGAGGAGGYAQGAYYPMWGDYGLSSGGSYGGGNSDSNASWYGGGGGGGGFQGNGSGGGTTRSGGSGYQGIVIIRNARS